MKKKGDKTMSQLFCTFIITDLQNKNCTNAEEEALLNVFKRAVDRMISELAHQVFQWLGRYAIAKQYGIESFTMSVEHKEVCGQHEWHGVFENGSKSLKVIAKLEE